MGLINFKKYNLFVSSNLLTKTNPSTKNIFLTITLLFFFFITLLPYNVQAATIRGTTYDQEIRPIKDVLIEINTTPIQRFLARDGTFLFSIPPGTYNISASFDSQTETFHAEEIIVINDNGKYLRDLFLKSIPKNQTEIIVPANPSFFEQNKSYFIYGTGAIIGLFIIWISYFLIKKSKHENPNSKTKDALKAKDETKEDIELIIKIMKKNGGRITQKDIRKEISLSEAKVSLMISELEEKGIIKKIKKGRGNILILN